MLKLRLDPVKLVLQVQVSTDIARPCMALEQLDSCRPAAKTAQLAAGLGGGDLLVRYGAQELADPETTGVASSVLCGKDVVGTDALEKERL